MNRFLGCVAVVVLAVCLLPALGSAQSMEQANKLIYEGRALRDNPKSKADMELALQKFQAALAIYEKVRSQKGQGVALNDMARAYQASGQSQKALEYFEKSLPLLKKSNEHKGVGVTLDYMGRIYFNRGEHQKALEYYEKGLVISRKVGDIKQEGYDLIDIALVYDTLGQNAKALEYYEKSLIICRKAGTTDGEQSTLLNMGTLWQKLDQDQKALEAYEKSLEVCKKIRDMNGEGQALNRVGMAYSALGDKKKALEFYEQSLRITQKVGNKEGESAVLNNMGLIHLGTGHYAKALDCHQKSLEIDKKIGFPRGRPPTLNNIALVYNSMGQYQRALEQYENVIEEAKKTRDEKTERAALVNMAVTYTSLGQYQKALELLEKSLQMAKKLGDAENQFQALFDMASAYESSGEYDKALAHYLEAAKVFGKGRAANYRMGLLYLSMGDIPKAESFLKESHGGQIEIFAGARIALAKLDFEKAVDPLKIHLSVSRQSRNVKGIFTGYTSLGLAYEGLGQYEAAAENYTQAIRITEEMRDGLTGGQRVNFFDTRLDGIARLTPYEGLCRALLQTGKLDEAFKQAESTRARTFSESLTRRANYIALDVPVNILEKDSDINNRLAALIQERQKSYEKSAHWILTGEEARQYKDAEEKAKSVEKQIKELLLERDHHASRLRKEYPLFAATKYPQPMNLRESALKDDEWVLEYEVTDSGVVIFLAEGKEIIKGLFKAIERKEIDSLVRKYREPLEIKEGRGMEQLKDFDLVSGKKLADILLSDVLPLLPKDAPVIIIPSGSLGTVPFEMLVLNDGGKIQIDKTIPYVSGVEFFGDRNPISYYQSVTALTLARTLGRQQKTGDRTLAMVDPVFSPDDVRLVHAATKKRRGMLDKLSSEKLMSFKTELALEIPRLPLTSQLGESLKKADPAKTDLYEGLTAQKAVLLQRDLKPYRSLVFATHGYFGKDLPGIQEPVLILTLPGQPEGQDGFLRMTEVMRLKLNCDVAALTACQTGLGRHISGEGTMGMGRAFQYAGAKSVLMSLWSVAEKSSVQMVESFFKHLKEGKNRLEALKLARDEIRKAGYDHPFFWAPFILVGEVN